MKTIKNVSLKNTVLTLALLLGVSFSQFVLAEDQNTETVKHAKNTQQKQNESDANKSASSTDEHTEAHVDRREQLRERHLEEHHEHN